MRGRIGRHAPTVLFAPWHPRAGQLPEAGDLVDVDALLAAYRDDEPPSAAGRVRHVRAPRHVARRHASPRRTSLAISEAVCRYRAEQGIDGPLFLGRDTHALSEPAARTIVEVLAGARRRRRRRRRRRLHADAGDLARDPHAQPRRQPRAPPARRDRRHAVAQPARRRRLQVQPAARRAGRHRRHRLDRARGQRLLEDGLRRRRRASVRRRRTSTAARLRLAPTSTTCASVIDLDAIRARRAAARRRPARRRERRLLAGDRRAPRARPRDRQRRGRPDLPLRPARLGRQDPDGLLVAVRDGAAARARRPLRRRVRQRPRRRPPRHRHAGRRPAEPQPPPRRVHRLPVRRRTATGATDVGVGKTLVARARSSTASRPTSAGALVEVPVGFKWFVDGPARRLARASAARRAPAPRSCAATAAPWSTDKDGLIPCLLAAEMKATTGKDPGELLRGAGRALRPRRLQAHRRRRRAPSRRTCSSGSRPSRCSGDELAGEPIEPCSPRRPATARRSAG